jgi:hypothetical protein
MNVNFMSNSAETFLGAVLSADWRLAYSSMAHVPVNDLFRTLGVLDTDDLNKLIDHDGDSDSAQGVAAMNLQYAMNVVSEGKSYPVIMSGMDADVQAKAEDYVTAVIKAR